MKVLVTGGCSGLGLVFTKFLLSKGNYVIALYNSSYDNVKKLMSEYDNLQCIQCDITDEERVKEVIDGIDYLDLVINNAAIAIDNEYKDKSYREFMNVLSVNVGGTFNVIKYASQKMQDGVIINISSDNSLGNNNVLSMDYDASKAGVNMLTLNFSEALPNVKVIAYAPGWINTDAVKEMNPNYLKEELERCNQDCLIEPSQLVKFILDDYKYQISGSIIPIKEV